MSNENKPLTAKETLLEHLGYKRPHYIFGLNEAIPAMEAYAAQQVAAALAADPAYVLLQRMFEAYADVSGYDGLHGDVLAYLQRFDPSAAMAEKKEPIKLMGASEMINEYMREHKGSDFDLMDVKNLMDQFASQQTAALREELEVEKKHNEHLTLRNKEAWNAEDEMRKNWYKAVSELEAVKKERNQALNDFANLQFSSVNEKRRRFKELSSDVTKPVSQWISVEERLPEKESSCLACANKGVHKMYYGLNSDNNYKWFIHDEPVRPYMIPSHWMPLPDPPESLKDKK